MPLLRSYLRAEFLVVLLKTRPMSDAAHPLDPPCSGRGAPSGLRLEDYEKTVVAVNHLERSSFDLAPEQPRCAGSCPSRYLAAS